MVKENTMDKAQQCVHTTVGLVRSSVWQTKPATCTRLFTVILCNIPENQFAYECIDDLTHERGQNRLGTGHNQHFLLRGMMPC